MISKRKPGIVAYRITPGDEHPNIAWGGVVSPDIVVTPSQAVAALREHGFTEIYIAITQTSADQFRHIWTR